MSDWVGSIDEQRGEIVAKLINWGNSRGRAEEIVSEFAEAVRRETLNEAADEVMTEVRWQESMRVRGNQRALIMAEQQRAKEQRDRMKTALDQAEASMLLWADVLADVDAAIDAVQNRLIAEGESLAGRLSEQQT